MLKVHKKDINNIIIKIMCASACVRTRSCAKNRRRGRLRNKAIRPMTYARIMRANEDGQMSARRLYGREKYCKERKAVPEAAKVDVEAEKSRIIEYQGLITGIKRQELVWNAVSGRCCSV